MDKRPVIVIGSLNYDVFLHVARLPKIGETYCARGMEVSAGGKGANQAVQCAKLGLETLLVGAVGQDAMGDFLLGSLQRHQVRTDFVRQVPKSTGFAAVHALEDGRVGATIVRGANGCVSRRDVDGVAPLMEGAIALVLQLEIPTGVVEYAIEKANAVGLPVLLNAAPAGPLSQKALEGCDTFIANEVEASFYTGREIAGPQDALEAIGPFARQYGLRAIFTLGEKGAVAWDGKGAHIPALKTAVVETTGAGDSFVGGYLKAVSAGMDFWAAIRFATHCSAVTVSGVGGQEAMPLLSQVQEFLPRFPSQGLPEAPDLL